MEETTDWISFKDIPTFQNKIRFEKLIPVDVLRYSVNYGYSHQVKIGEIIQMKALGTFMPDWLDEKIVTIKF